MVVRSIAWATRAAITTALERPGSMCILSHSHDGTLRSVSGSGCTQTPRSWPGPGARLPQRWTRLRKPAKASWPVTFCSMIAGTSASITRPLRPIRQSRWWRQTSAMIWWWGSKPLGSSSAPSSPGTDSSAQSAPSPQAAV